jgi:DNA-binding response OmpR family regulator
VTEAVLRDRRILVVEDEFLLAEELQYELASAGAVVIGMASTVADALELIRVESHLDAAILDVNLGGTPVFPVADRLREQGVPFVFTTGYDASAIPTRFKDSLSCEKPFDVTCLLKSIRQLLGG